MRLKPPLYIETLSVKTEDQKMADDTDKKENAPKDTPNEEEKTQMDRELGQTFPASDPPSRSRPGHETNDDDES